MSCCTDIILVIVALFFPPLPVMIRRGICSADAIINIALCFLGYIPGTLHAWYIIASYPGNDKQYYRVNDEEAVYYVSRAASHQQPCHAPSNKKKRTKKPHAQNQLEGTSSQAQQDGQQINPQHSHKNNSHATVTYGSINDSQAGTSRSHANSDHSNNAPPPSYAEVVHQSLENLNHNPTDNKQTI